MVQYNPGDLPSPAQVFGKSSPMTRLLMNHEISSIVPVMLLCPNELHCLPGIGPATVNSVGRSLVTEGLPQRQFNDRLSDFVDQVFGNIADAPITVLMVSQLDAAVCTRLQLAPTRALQVLHKEYPTMTLEELMAHTPKELAAVLTDIGHHMHNVNSEVYEVNRRIRRYGADFQLGAIPVPSMH